MAGLRRDPNQEFQARLSARGSSSTGTALKRTRPARTYRSYRSEPELESRFDDSRQRPGRIAPHGAQPTPPAYRAPRTLEPEIPVQKPADSEDTAGGCCRRNASFLTTLAVATTSSEQVLPQNSRRAYLIVQNNGGVDIFVAFNRGADSTSGLKISAGGYYEPYTPPTSSVSLVAASSAANVVLIEGTS